ncbi:MAG: BPSS1780 family membrane protein, partial [Porticoccaceae bacterium]
TAAFNGIAAVDAGRGVYWITQAYKGYVGRALGGWIGATLIYMLLIIVLSLVPLLGSLATMLLAPVLVGGFMLGAKAQDKGENFALNHLFSAFSQNSGQLMLVGLLYMAGAFAVGILAVILFGGAFLSFGALASNPESFSSLASSTGFFLLPLLLVMLLVIPLAMAYWFAPALIVLSGLPATTAMAQSFKGCLKNILPFLVYGIVAAVLAIIAAIPLFLGFLILVPVLTASMYVAWKDIFGQS